MFKPLSKNLTKNIPRYAQNEWLQQKVPRMKDQSTNGISCTHLMTRTSVLLCFRRISCTCMVLRYSCVATSGMGRTAISKAHVCRFMHTRRFIHCMCVMQPYVMVYVINTFFHFHRTLFSCSKIVCSNLSQL
jgi:hypothetical protein